MNGDIDPRSSQCERLALMAKALGHPIRVRILRYLRSRSSCMVGSIVDVLPVAQSTTSQHLKILKDSGWITGTIDGHSTCYCLNEENIAWYKDRVQEMF